MLSANVPDKSATIVNVLPERVHRATWFPEHTIPCPSVKVPASATSNEVTGVPVVDETVVVPVFS